METIRDFFRVQYVRGNKPQKVGSMKLFVLCSDLCIFRASDIDVTQERPLAFSAECWDLETIRWKIGRMRPTPCLTFAERKARRVASHRLARSVKRLRASR